MSDNLPEKLQEQLKLVTKAEDRLSQFRAYVKLLDRGYKSLEKLGTALRKQERNYEKLKSDLAFFSRHRMKVDVLIRAMRETYSNSTKALRALEELAQHYPPHYVFEVCQLGSYRLGGVQGWAFLNIRSVARMDADTNYEQAVLPAIAQVLPDHRDYLELRAAGIEEQIGAELEKLNEMRRAKVEIEGSLPKWTEQMTALAAAMKPAETDRLNAQELAVYERLVVPSKMPLASSA